MSPWICIVQWSVIREEVLFKLPTQVKLLPSPVDLLVGWGTQSKVTQFSPLWDFPLLYSWGARPNAGLPRSARGVWRAGQSCHFSHSQVPSPPPHFILGPSTSHPAVATTPAQQRCILVLFVSYQHFCSLMIDLLLLNPHPAH